MRIILAGTPAVALAPFEALADSGHEIAGVITRPPARQGRSKRLVESPVAKWAGERGFNLLETNRPGDDEALKWIDERQADLGVIVAYGALLRANVLDSLPNGWINLHFSALPHLRGAAPVQHAILNQDLTIGTTVFQLDEGMDSGPILSIEERELPATWTSGEALEILSEESAVQLVEAVDSIANGIAVFTPQGPAERDSKVTFAPKLERSDGYIAFTEKPAETAARSRAVTPAPGAWTKLDGQTFRLGVLQIADNPERLEALEDGEIKVEKHRVLVGCGGGAVVLGEVAPAGKQWMDAAAWSRGARLRPKTKLGVQDDA